MCEEARLRPATYTGELKHRGQTIPVENLERYVCDACGADPVLEDQIGRNHAKYMEARRKADGLLSSEEIRALRKGLGLTQQKASRIFGGGANAFSKYERGDVMQSLAMDRLLRLVDLQPGLLELLQLLSGEGKPGVENFQYHTRAKLNFNDDQYRSRRVQGNVTHVSEEHWVTRESA